MAKLQARRFVPTPEDAKQGAQPMTKEEIITALEAYKKQNPTKYEMKKEALFKMYGLLPEEEAVSVPDANDVELAEIKKAVTKKKDAK
jgi:hypothetical protein